MARTRGRARPTTRDELPAVEESVEEAAATTAAAIAAARSRAGRRAAAAPVAEPQRSPGEEVRFLCLTNVHSGGKMYAVGSVVSLTAAQAAPIRAHLEELR